MTAIHEVSENFRHEIDKLRHEFSGHRILNPLLTETAEVTSLQNENRDLKRRLCDLEEVKISSFPGCTTLDMKDHVKPLLRRNPDKIILHVRTNSLRSCKSARACAEEMVDLASMVGTESTAKITISSLVGRSDDETLASKITDVNKVIKQFCNQNNWGFVDHSNISVNSHLNRSGLHLNKSGTSRLARNLINHLNLE